MRSFNYCLITFLLLISCQQDKRLHILDDLCVETTSSNNDGFTKIYFKDSKQIKAIGHYKNGLKDGFWKSFYTRGNLASEGHFERGQKKGYWKHYYKNGNLAYEGHIKNCKPTGYWKFYKENGLLESEHTY